MHRVIAGATGLIGKRLVEHWLQQKHTITVIGRSDARIKEAFGDRVTAVTWGKVKADDIKSAELIVNLTGENVGGRRWTEPRKKEILLSRTGSTKKLAGLLCEIPDNIPRLINASGIGIYGLQASERDGLPTAIDEDTIIDWENPKGFMDDLGIRWEKAAEPAIAHGAKVIFLRFGVVIAPEGGALPQFMKPFKFYIGCAFGNGRQPFSWVSIDDVLRSIDFLVQKKELTGAFNIVSPGCVTQVEFVRSLGRVLNKPTVIKIPEFILKPVLGQMAVELLIDGQNVYPKRLIDLGYKFSYPELETALNHVLRGSASSVSQKSKKKQKS